MGENQQTISSLNARQTCNQFFNMSPARNLTFKHDWTKLNGRRMAIISKSWSASPSFLFAGGFLVAQFVRMLRLQKCQLRNFIACFNFVFSCFLFPTFWRNTNQVLNDIGHHHFTCSWLLPPWLSPDYHHGLGEALKKCLGIIPKKYHFLVLP